MLSTKVRGQESFNEELVVTERAFEDVVEVDVLLVIVATSVTDGAKRPITSQTSRAFIRLQRKSGVSFTNHFFTTTYRKATLFQN